MDDPDVVTGIRAGAAVRNPKSSLGTGERASDAIVRMVFEKILEDLFVELGQPAASRGIQTPLGCGMVDPGSESREPHAPALKVSKQIPRRFHAVVDLAVFGHRRPSSQVKNLGTSTEGMPPPRRL